MDIEWAQDAPTETIHPASAAGDVVSRRAATAALEIYALGASGKVLASGRAVGEKIASGPVRVIAGAGELGNFKPGEVLVAESTRPDWEPVMKIAAAIVTERGGKPVTLPSSPANSACRPWSAPRAPRKPEGGAVVTVSCAQGEVGMVYKGPAVEDRAARALANCGGRTAIMLNSATPIWRSSWRTAKRRRRARRMEIIISEPIKVHPMALVSPDKVAAAPGATEDPRADRGTPNGGLLCPPPCRRGRYDRGRFLSEGGDRAAVRFQDQRVADCSAARDSSRWKTTR